MPEELAQEGEVLDVGPFARDALASGPRCLLVVNRGATDPGRRSADRSCVPIAVKHRLTYSHPVVEDAVEHTPIHGLAIPGDPLLSGDTVVRELGHHLGRGLVDR
jgi:hypothetical protein